MTVDKRKIIEIDFLSDNIDIETSKLLKDKLGFKEVTRKYYVDDECVYSTVSDESAYSHFEKENAYPIISEKQLSEWLKTNYGFDIKMPNYNYISATGPKVSIGCEITCKVVPNGSLNIFEHKINASFETTEEARKAANKYIIDYILSSKLNECLFNRTKEIKEEPVKNEHSRYYIITDKEHFDESVELLKSKGGKNTQIPIEMPNILTNVCLYISLKDSSIRVIKNIEKSEKFEFVEMFYEELKLPYSEDKFIILNGNRILSTELFETEESAKEYISKTALKNAKVKQIHFV